MAVVVLGLDGLEYELVKKFKLNSVKQKRYIKTDLTDFAGSFTPVIWASMLTGKKDRNMEAVFGRVDEKKDAWSKIKRKVFGAIRERVGDWFDTHVGTVPWNPHLKTRAWLRKQGILSILEEVKSWHVSIPGHSGFPEYHDEQRKLARLYLKGDLKAGERYKKITWKTYRKRKEKLFRALEKKKDYDLFFFYTNLLDALGHLFQTDRILILKAYMEIHSLVKMIKSKLDSEDILYLVSDHGMTPLRFGGDHSNYGFFSSNTGELIRKPQELYTLLKKKCVYEN
jgi:hypothetical protein